MLRAEGVLAQLERARSALAAARVA